ncbi:MAG: DUF2130 domain-containing protein [bacterium]|nr:DUF2130 domain-containing protein [bacterium]
MNTIKCPKCGSLVEITEVLKNEIKQESQEEFEKELRSKIDEEKKTEILDLKKALDEKNQKVDQMRDQELKLREEKRNLEEREKELTLEVGRRIDEERKKIEETVLKRAIEEHQLKDLEKDKVINDLKKSLEEAQRKATQGSQQAQGEVLELQLEETLRSQFPNDVIEPVGKGVKGADVRQIVKSPGGHKCGVILWESKQTKAWEDGWLDKLKSDLRDESANIPIIVSTILPKEAGVGLGIKDNVWVTSYALAVPLAILLRNSLIDLAKQKYDANNREEKEARLYEYIVGHEFRQQVEAMVEVYKDMQEQIIKEKVAFERSWKIREEQVTRLLLSTAKVCGSIGGRVGQSMPSIKGLELLELADGKN